MSTESRFASEQPLELESYRPISRLAVIACVLAVLGIGSIISPIFWLFPPLAALLAWLSLRTIRGSKGELAGRGLARSALWFALIFLAWVPTQELATTWWLNRHAREYGQEWMELVQQRELEEALSHTREGDTDPYYVEKDKALGYDDLGEFFGKEPLKTIVMSGQAFEFGGYEGVIRDSVGDRVRVRFDVTVTDGQGTRIVPVILTLERIYFNSAGKFRWHIAEAS